MILRCFGSLMVDSRPELRVEKALDFWGKLKGLGVEVDASHFNALLRSGN